MSRATKTLDAEVKEYSNKSLKEVLTATFGTLAASAIFVQYGVVVCIRALKSLAE